MESHRQFWVQLFALPLCLSLGCDSKPEAGAQKPASSAPSPDRLKPGERPSGTPEVFGIPVPDKLTIQHAFADRALLQGRARVEDLSTYFREYVHVQHVEVIPGGTVFPRVHIKGDPLKRQFRIEIRGKQGKPTQVRIRNITPPPPTPKMPEAKAWEQAGRNPDGTLKNRLQQY